MRTRLLFILVLLSICISALAQTNTGEIVGTVTDSSGALLPNAAITITNMDTNLAVKTTTDGGGNYVVTPLLVGRYSVAAEASGFKTEIRSGINVDVQSRIRTDFVLQVGTHAETVEVRAPNVLLQTDTSYVGQVMDTQRVDDLPLNGRYLTRLAILAPGATPETTGSKDSATGGFSVNGLRPYQNTYLLDGIDNNNRDPGLTGGIDYVIGPPPDAVGEFRLQTNNMSAEFGISAGGVMNVTIKSGTNSFHGDAYEFVRNNDLNAKNFFDSHTAPIPPYKENQFGVTTGGPVVIPGVYDGRNKTFFFGDFQVTRIRQGLTDIATVLPAAWRVGNFAGFRTIFDPATTVVTNGVATRQPFMNNLIPMNRIDKAANNLINMIYPMPNLPGTQSSSGVANNFLYNPVLVDDLSQFDVRLDHRFSDRDGAMLRFSFADEPHVAPPKLPIGTATSTEGVFQEQTRQGVVTETHIFNPRTINEVRAAYTYAFLAQNIYPANYLHTDVAAEVGIPGVPFANTAYPVGNGGVPYFNVSGLTRFGSTEGAPTLSGETLFQFLDIVTMVRGPHTIKLGAEWKPRLDIAFLQPNAPRGRFYFNGDPTKDPNNTGSTGLGGAAFLLGIMNEAELTNGLFDTFQQPGYSFFIQDDYKMTRKLTWNVGLRYQFDSNPTERHNAMSNFDLKTDALDIVKGRSDPLPAYFDFADIPVNRNAPRTLVPNHHLDFAPRIGFAYNILPKTVIRSGYGIFYTSFEAGPLSSPNMGDSNPFEQNVTYNEVSVVTPNPTVSQLSLGFPSNVFSTGAPGQAQGLFSLSPTFRNPYAQAWNFGIQQELGFGMVWDIEYAGSAGTRLYEFRDINTPSATANSNISVDSRSPFPFMNDDPALYCSCGNSMYHALQTKVEKRFSSGLSFLAAYAFGKTIDEMSEASLGEGSGQGADRDPTRFPGWERGLADFDTRQRFVFSYSYDLPVGHGKKFGGSMGRGANAVLGGWQFVGIDAVQTGVPLTIAQSSSAANSDGQPRPDVNKSAPLYPASRSPSEWYNPGHFQEAAAGTYGNTGRDTVEGPGMTEIDFSLFKNFRVGERYRVEFRSEFFNIINHPNFQTSSLGSTFDAGGAGALTAANPSRQIQLALKLFF